MDGFNLFAERDDLLRRLTRAIELMGKYGREYAQAEHDYKVELAQTALKLKSDGMTATMMQYVIHGTGNVPKKRMERDVAEAMYKTAQENIQAVKMKLRVVEAQLDREWGQAARGV